MARLVIRKDIAEEASGKLFANQNIFSESENIEKSRIPKYIQKIPLGNGEFKHIYFDDKTTKTRELLPRIDYTKEKVLQCNIHNADVVGKQFLKDWNNDWKKQV